MNKMMLLLWMFFSCSISAKECLVTRAAFDIGSGSTKMKVAEIDKCKGVILKVLGEGSKAVGFKDDLEKNGGIFSESIVIASRTALEDLKKSALGFQATEFVAVATAAFRKATNGEKVAKELANSLSFKIRIISQTEEALLGFNAAKSSTGFSNLIVWDIGGGSMQITYLNQGKKLAIYEGSIASVTFKNQIISQVKKMDSKAVTTPNPLSKGELESAVTLADQLAKSDLKKHLPALKGQKIVGIGGVHYSSIKNQLSKDSYSQADLELLLSKKVGLDDKQIGGEYASTDVSNIALVLGFMKALNTPEVIVKKINMTDGILLLKNEI